MGTFGELRQSLRNLCHGTKWKYAVFWKLKHRSRMLLTWEDGYCVPTKPRDAPEDTCQNGIFNGETGIISFAHEMDALGGSSTGCPIELAVANMSCHLYSLGEGIIGKVPFTGKHRWISVKSLDSKIPSEYPEEWQVQFAAGIQTILLVPVIPYGVVQLGSLEVVMEDLKVVTYIKDLFGSFQHTDGEPFTLDRDPFDPLSSTSSLPGRGFSSLSAVSVDQWIQPQAELSMKKDLVVPRMEQMSKNVPNVYSHFSPPLRIPDDLSVTQTNMQHILRMDMGLCIDGTSWKAIYNAISGSVLEQSCIANHSLSSDSDIMENGNRCHSPRYEFKEPHQRNTIRSSIFCSDNEDLQGDYDYCFMKETNEQSLGTEDFEMSHKASGSYLSFPIDSELHKALGSAFLQGNDTCVMECFSGENVLGSSFPACKMEETGTHDFVDAEYNEWLLKQNETEHLLDAVISSFYASDDSASNQSRGTSPSTSSGQFTDSCLTHIKYENNVLPAADSSGLMNHAKSPLPSKSVLMTFPSGSQSKSGSMLMDEEQQNGKGYEQFKRNIKSPYVGKRKAKGGTDSDRPRPRDRQLIQDRIKELRELVPSGSKCSIDALLDRTIKHMQFLQSISSQADKLKQYAHSKVDGEKRKATEPAGHQNGASWAYDLGSQTEVCPIVVENLDQPGHMLVEMLCSEYGLFLEIAQVIKHLELTILKGVMETRSHKLWAHFIVEASRGFHRMDILWPLMQLLQRQCSPITSAF